jgi:hypothetical protein
MTGDEKFYEVCDKWGILIMDDFWLANPSDGPITSCFFFNLLINSYFYFSSNNK